MMTMNSLEKFDRWTDERRAPAWIDLFRIIVGVYLFYKGYQFTVDFDSLTEGISSMDLVFMTIPAAHYVHFSHLIGGILIAFGAYTRTCCALNIPILMGAVVFNYQMFPTAEDHMEIGVAIGILVALIGLFALGGGRFSLDELRRRDMARKREMTA